jgi:hypothetical protein
MSTCAEVGSLRVCRPGLLGIPVPGVEVENRNDQGSFFMRSCRGEMMAVALHRRQNMLYHVRNEA